jgi:RNase P/RNase MRP subunit POP5
MRPGRVSSLSLVRYNSNESSVPVAYGHREVLVRGYVERVVISCVAQVIARHRRSYEREDLVFDSLYYLPLIERKVGAFDQAAPLRGWDFPEAFATLRRLLEARMGPRNHGAAGKREYVQVLRLFESFPLGEFEAAIRAALSYYFGPLGHTMFEPSVVRKKAGILDRYQAGQVTKAVAARQLRALGLCEPEILELGVRPAEALTR